MATVYNYATRQITRDFRFVKVWEPCHRSQLPCHAASSWCCKCQYYAGRIDINGCGEFLAYILCKHPAAVDSKGYETALKYFNEQFELEALSYLDL